MSTPFIRRLKSSSWSWTRSAAGAPGFSSKVSGKRKPSRFLAPLPPYFAGFRYLEWTLSLV
jgi:hypothetical protein